MQKLLALAALTTFVPAASGQVLDFGSFDKRLTALETRVTALEGNQLPPPRPGHAPGTEPVNVAHVEKLTYAEAHAKALAENLPLVCWVGGGDAVCPACVHTLADEVVSFVGDSVPGNQPGTVQTGPGLFVAMPEGGNMVWTAAITEWRTGDATFGHTPSIRRAIRHWREQRGRTQGGWSMGTMATASTTTTAKSQVQMRAAPMRAPAARMAPVRMMRGAACSSCG